MKKLSLLLALVTLFLLPATLHAITYPFPEKELLHMKDEAVMKAGAKVYLFHSGTAEVKNDINVNDVLTVYQEYPPDFSLETKEVGKVRVLSAEGNNYFIGEVIEGHIQPGYLAKKGTVACFIMSLKITKGNLELKHEKGGGL